MRLLADMPLFIHVRTLLETIRWRCPLGSRSGFLGFLKVFSALATWGMWGPRGHLGGRPAPRRLAYWLFDILRFFFESSGVARIRIFMGYFCKHSSAPSLIFCSTGVIQLPSSLLASRTHMGSTCSCSSSGFE